jgi:tetratricopeptide (TPR) repeat protein
MEAVCAGRPVTVEVDGRSDVYSLALVLYQALSGQVPMQSPPPRLEECNPRVSIGLADVIHKCLAREPRGRYKDAAALASDLRRHLAHLPLKGVPNRNLPERWRKWRRRKPHALAILLLLLVMLTTAAAVGWFTFTELQDRRLRVRKSLDLAREQIKQGDYERALHVLDTGWGTAEATPGAGEFEPQFARLTRAAKHGRVVQTLHGLVERLRFLPGVDDLSTEDLKQLEAKCRVLWNAREQLLADPEPAEGGTQPLNLELLKTDLLDLAVIWTELHVRLHATGEDQQRVWRQALDVLDQAERLFGESSVLAYEREKNANRLGLREVAEAAFQKRRTLEKSARSAWDEYALGRSFLHGKKHEEAMPYLERAVTLEPRGFWPLFYKGVCAYRLGMYHDAVAAFGASIAATPASAREQAAQCYYNRGLAEMALGQDDRALEDYKEAEKDLTRNSEMAALCLNRGIVKYRRGDKEGALNDLRVALEKGCDPLMGNYNLARVYQAFGRRDDALASVHEALKVNPRHAESLELLGQLITAPSR